MDIKIQRCMITFFDCVEQCMRSGLCLELTDIHIVMYPNVINLILSECGGTPGPAVPEHLPDSV